jgi:predicted nucleotidyltransferase
VAADAPVRALRELAEWQLGAATASEIRRQARSATPDGAMRAPSTITSPRIRGAWPKAIGAIVSQFDPVRIILFGSQARGDARPDSDVDLLVVFDGYVDRRERQIAIARTLAAMPFAKDVLVASAAEVGHPMMGTAMAEAFREGVTVYER